MDFDVSEQMRTILDLVGSFMDAEVIPLEGEMLHGDPVTLDAAVASAQDKVRQMGLWASNHPGWSSAASVSAWSSTAS